VNTGNLGSQHDFLVSCLWSAERNIAFHSVVVDVSLITLRYESAQSPQFAERPVPNIDTTDQDAASTAVVEPGNQAPQRRFASP
jgi:hypothetical protein